MLGKPQERSEINNKVSHNWINKSIQSGFRAINSV